jgi:hypothetical protein
MALGTTDDPVLDEINNVYPNLSRSNAFNGVPAADISPGIDEDGIIDIDDDERVVDTGYSLDFFVEKIAKHCEDPPSVNTTESHSTISCLWLPSELKYQHELGFSCTIKKCGRSHVITAVVFSKSSRLAEVVEFFATLNDRVSLPFYIMSDDHACMFLQRTLWREMCEKCVEPPACPMIFRTEMSSSSVHFAIASSDSASVFSDSRYSQFIEWLDVPPTFPRGQQPPLPSGTNMFLPIDIKVIESLMQRNLKSCNSLSSRM